MNAEDPKLSVDDIKNSSFDDPGGEPVWQFFVSFCAQQPAKRYPNKEFQALAKLPPKLRDVCLLLRYELYWGSGGTQDAAVLEDRESSVKMLKMTAAAYSRYGDKKREKLMVEIISKLAEHESTLDEADRNDKLDDYISPLDKYDRLWEAVRYDYTGAILKDMKSSPQEYTYPQQDPNKAARP